MNVCSCAEQVETFWTLFQSGPHWAFEIFLMLLFDGLVGAIAWPFVKRHYGHHLQHDRIHEGERR